MRWLLRKLFGFLKIFGTETSVNQMAVGIMIGWFLGLIPVFTLQFFLLLLVLIFFRIQLTATIISAIIFAIPAIIFSFIFHLVGSFVLEINFLYPLFTFFYNIPIIPLTRFYNSVVMGSMVIATVFAPVVFFISRLIIIKYREKIVERFKKTKLYKFIESSFFYKWYYKYDKLYG